MKREADSPLRYYRPLYHQEVLPPQKILLGATLISSLQRNPSYSIPDPLPGVLRQVAQLVLPSEPLLVPLLVPQ